MSSPSSINRHHHPLPSNPLSFPQNAPNMGRHRVDDASKGVSGLFEQAKGEIDHLKDRWAVLGKKEQSYYVTAATCAAIAIFIFAILTMLFGAVGVALALPLMVLPALGSAGSQLRGKALTSRRKPWEMPPIPQELKANKESSEQWTSLWNDRNQAKKSLANVRAQIAKKKKSRIDFSKEVAYAKILQNDYEKAELEFWKFADRDKATDKMDAFNDDRTNRGETELLVMD